MASSIHRVGTVFLALLFTVFHLQAQAQTPNTQEGQLFGTLKAADSRLFDTGFNGHDIKPFEELIDDNIEFYHDKGGITLGKAAFLDSIRQGIFNISYHARRELVPGSLKVYPLEKNGVLYGAVQTGEHRFHALETGKPEYQTSQALFTHLWLLKEGRWKLARALSYDHESVSQGGKQ